MYISHSKCTGHSEVKQGTSTRTMNSTEVQNPRCKVDVFSSVLACAKSDLVFQKLLLALRTLSLSFVTIFYNSPSDSKAFRRFIAFSGSPTAVHRTFSFFDAKAWPQAQTDLFTCTMVLHCGYTFLRCIDLTYGIALWAQLSALLVKDRHKCLSSTEKPQYRVLQHLPLRTCYGEVYGNNACEENG